MGHSARFELKYIIEEPRAVAAADFVSSYLRPSEHNGSGPIRGHPVISLYLDSPDFFLFRQAYTGAKNRMKLRIRFYDDEWQRPAFLEIKRRVGEVICKDRAMMTREGVRRILAAGWPPGALSVMPMSNEVAAKAVADDRFKLLTFTGSAAVGWQLKQRCGKKKIVLELGGNAGVIIHTRGAITN